LEDGPAAEVRWDRYIGSVGNISVLLPKNPVVITNINRCNETYSVEYWSYAEEAVYGFKIFYKSGVQVPEYCEVKTSFDRAAFDKRLGELETKAGSKGTPSDFTPNSVPAWKIPLATGTTWVFDDLQNGRWVELLVIRRPENKVDENRFIRSIDLSGKQAGIGIGDGAERTLGDPKAPQPDIVKPEIVKEGTNEKPEGMVIAAKPRASYTDAARRADTQGSVTLRITFQANGTIGGIVVVSGLKRGLTEEALKAARKIVFLPQRMNGRPIPVVKTVQYVFSIY
jgi:TonB family protein